MGARPIAALAAGWLSLALASPGVLTGAGSVLLAVLGVFLWGYGSSGQSSRPRLSFLIEVAFAGAAWSWICSWSVLVHWTSLLFIAPGMGLYAAASGVLFRRIARGFSAALALPAAWVCIEVVRSSLEPPFGLPWMRLGTHLHGWSPLAASAQLWGFYGLSWVLAAWAGGALSFVRRDVGTPRAVGAAAAALAPTVIALAAGWLGGTPATEPGPRVLLVQPGIEQERKMQGLSARELFTLQRDLTLRGLQEAGEPVPDLVVWGESMLPIFVAHADLAAAVRGGMRAPPWARYDFGPEELAGIARMEESWVGAALFGRESGTAVVPAGTSFASGVEVLLPHDGHVRRQNAVVLWDGDGTRTGSLGKRHLVPGAETMLGLERFGFVRRIIDQLAGYVPDLAPAEGRPWLEMTARDGRRYRFGVSVCFDNAFEDPFTAPVREGAVDFHLVVSNEAWFRESLEFDQMIAFSRILAIGTGRSVVRATNSGISTVIDPAGRELERLRVHGRDRAVGGTLALQVPVPVGGALRAPGRGPGDAAGIPAVPGGARITPFVRFELAWILIGGLAGPLLAAGSRRARNRRREAG